MEKNIKRFKYYLLLKNAILIGPIVTLFFLGKGLTYLEIMIISAIFRIFWAFFEVPTGAVADFFGNKFSMQIGLFVMGLVLLIYPFGASFSYFIVMEIFFALGMALVSGADTALLYDSLKEVGREKEYSKQMGIAKQYSFLMQIVGSIVSAFLFQIYYGLPYIMSGFLLLSAILIVFSFKEIDHIHKKAESVKEYLLHIKNSGNYILHHVKIRTIIIYAALLSMFYGSIVNLYAPYFLEVGVDPIYFGFIFAGFNIITFFCARYTDVFIKITKPKTLMVLGSLMFLSFLLLGVIHTAIGIAAIGLQQIFRSVKETVYTKYINKNVESERRATVLSFHSLATTLTSAIFSVFIGFIMDRYNIFTTHLILALGVGILLLIMNPILNKNLGKKKAI